MDIHKPFYKNYPFEESHGISMPWGLGGKEIEVESLVGEATTI